MTSVIDGKAVAASVLEECRAEVAELKAKGTVPGLAVVLVGDDPASHVYVGSKVRTCADLGLHSEKIVLPAETTQEELIAVVQRLNADPAIHGILVQSPPPKHIDEEAVVRAIDPRKDVDGFHPENVAKLALEDPTGFVPCTPAGCMRLLAAAGVKTAGAEAVVIGRSMISSMRRRHVSNSSSERPEGTASASSKMTRTLLPGAGIAKRSQLLSSR